MPAHDDVFTRFKERQRGSAPFDPSQGPNFIIQPSDIYLEQLRQRVPGSSPLSRKRKEFDDSVFDTPPDGLRIPLSDHDNSLPRRRLSIQSSSSYQSIKSKTQSPHRTTAPIQSPSARRDKISSPRVPSPSSHEPEHNEPESSKADTHTTVPRGSFQPSLKQTQAKVTEQTAQTGPTEPTEPIEANKLIEPTEPNEPQKNEAGDSQLGPREPTPSKTINDFASQQDSPVPGRQLSPAPTYPNVSFDDDFGAYDDAEIFEERGANPTSDKIGDAPRSRELEEPFDTHSPSAESLDPKTQQAQERDLAIQRVRAGFNKALSDDKPEGLNPNYFSRQLGDIDELIRTISRNTSGGTANFDPAVVQSTEELESSIMEQMNALRRNRQRYCELELYLRTMELLRGMRRKESVGLLKKRSDLKTRDAAARKEYQELKQKWKAMEPLGTLIEAMRKISSGE